MTDDNKNKVHLWSSEDQRMLCCYREDKIRQMMMEEYTPEEFWEEITSRSRYDPDKDFAYTRACSSLRNDTTLIRLFGNKEND
tara:strand:+ start:362 stop:610 length:249 start_codon:yes stop_codon:yes gene_type:complete